MQPWIMAASFAAIVAAAPGAALAGASQNPHDAVNQPSDDESQNPHDAVNQPSDTVRDTGTPNPNALGRTGRGGQVGDDGSGQSDQGVQPPAVNADPSNRIEDINDDDRRLHDRLDGSPDPSVDPSFNSDNPGEPVPPGEGPGVNSDTGDGNSATSRSDVAPRAGSSSGGTRSGSGGSSGTGTSGGGTGGTSGGAR